MATMKDVARLAKVSLGSVSNVINGKTVKPETQDRVEAAIKKLNYEKNDLASGFKTNKSNTIGLIIPSIWHPFFSEIAFFVEEELRKYGYKLLLCNSNNDLESEKEYIQMLRKNMIDGIIAITYSDVEVLINSNLPFVSIDRIFNKNVNFVSSQNYQGGSLAAETLKKKGASELLFIGSHNRFVNTTMDRRKGFEDFCKKEGIKYHLIDYPEPFELKQEDVLEMFRENQNIDGIFTISDLLALDLIKILEKIGKYPLKDYQLIGFDGIRLSSDRSYLVSTIAQPIEEIAKNSVRILLKSIEDNDYQESLYLEVCFKEGGTTIK